MGRGRRGRGGRGLDGMEGVGVGMIGDDWKYECKTVVGHYQ